MYPKQSKGLLLFLHQSQAYKSKFNSYTYNTDKSPKTISIHFFCSTQKKSEYTMMN